MWGISGGFLQTNNKVGGGLNVDIYFPSDGRGKISSIEKLAIDIESAVSKTILVVEDEHRVRRVTIRDLESLNYKTIEAGNAAMATSIIESGVDIDLIFSDILMPGNMDGRMLGDWVREHYPKIKIVLTSGYRHSEEGEKKPLREKDLEAFLIVNKPYSLDLLAERIRAAFGDA